MTAIAPYARQCCPHHALAELTAAELAALDRWCARALDDPDAEPAGPEEIAATTRYERLLHEAARGVWERERRRKYGRSGGSGGTSGSRRRRGGGLC